MLVDIDGVLSLFGAAGVAGGSQPATARAASGSARDAYGPLATAGADHRVAGSFHSIDGILHFLSSTAASHLLALWHLYEPVWASGWEEKANEYLPHLLGLPAALPYISFSARENAGRSPHAHWKLQSIAAYVGERPMAWIDDAHSPACHEWASARAAPTLLVSTAPEQGLTAKEAGLLLEWARSRSSRSVVRGAGASAASTPRGAVSAPVSAPAPAPNSVRRVNAGSAIAAKTPQL